MDLDPRVQSLFSREAQPYLDQVLKSGVRLDRFGMVIPKLNDPRTKEKITANLLDTRSRLAQVIAEGMHVIYLPGSYDLVHAGHASYVLQCVDAYKKKNTRIDKSKIFTVMLADDDDLIAAIKPSYLRDKPGEHPRPIQNHGMYQHFTKIHPRLLDLASLPVDLVGFLPAPTEQGNLLNDWLFKRWLTENGSFHKDAAGIAHLGNSDVDNRVRDNIQQYEALIHRIKDDKFDQVITAFQEARHDPSYASTTAAWNVEAWQLMLHKFLGSVPVAGGVYKRMISENDQKYKDLVVRIMQVSKIDHEFVDDKVVLSTTQLANTIGWKDLYESKVEAYKRPISLK